jgi:ornithine carbamoyltransferase
MEPKHLTSIRDLTAADVAEVFKLSAAVKSAPEKYRGALAGKSLALIFQIPSTGTRVSFQVGMHQLGGQALSLSESDLEATGGVAVPDTAKALSQYVDGIVARTRTHAELVELSRNAGVPVINGRTDLLHPCQALADYFTLAEKKGDLAGRKIAYVGAGGNMCHSLIYGAVKAGMHIAVATPAGSEPKSIIVKSANREASAAGVTVVLTQDPAAAIQGSDAVYTDRWGSPGQPLDDARAQILAPFQVNPELMAMAKPDAFFMHCLPAERGREVAAEVIDSAQSVVFEQARNRLHVQKAILCMLLGT